MWGDGGEGGGVKSVLTFDTIQNFCGSCYNIQFKPYATSKMELFVTKNKQWLETAADCRCYIELRLKC